MPIPTRARTSALGGYVTGHGKYPIASPRPPPEPDQRGGQRQWLGGARVAQLGAPRRRTARQDGGNMKAPDPLLLAAWHPVLLPGHAAVLVQRANRTPRRR